MYLYIAGQLSCIRCDQVICIVARANTQYDCRDEDKTTQQTREKMDVSTL